MRGKRLVQLIKAIETLARPQGATIEELSEALGRADRKAAYRAIETIEELGFPVYDEQLDGERAKRWRFEESYLKRLPNMSLPDFELNLPDIVALNLLRPYADTFSGTEIAERLERLFIRLDAFVPEGLGNRLQSIKSLFLADDKFAKDYSGKEEILDTLVQAMLERRTCLVEYEAFEHGKRKSYEIDPLHFFEHRDGLYVFARITKYGDIRILAVERMHSLEETTRSFDPPEDFDPKVLLEGAFNLTLGDPLEATVRVSAEQAKYVLERRYFRDRQVDHHEDGSITLRISTSGRGDVIRWVLGMGAGAEILDPEDLRDEVKVIISEMSRKYQ